VTAGVVEPLGADTLVFFEIGGREMVCRVPPEAAHRTGDKLRLTFDMSRMHLFDAATERAI
jgi:multiple sugar transport system ATP-binding protein